MDRKDMHELRKKQLQEKAAVIAEHTVKPDDTLSGLALKYYGNAGKKYYMVIYEANKKLIGDDPNVIVNGTVLKIPELPKGL